MGCGSGGCGCGPEGGETIQKQINQEGKVSADLMIGEAVMKYPSIVPVLQKYGIHCVGCGAASFETISQGLMAHGFDEKDVAKIIDELNEVVAKDRKENKTHPLLIEPGKNQEKKEMEMVELTDAAVVKLKDLMKKSNKEGFGLRVEVTPGGCSGFTYGMDFEEKPNDDDIVYERNGLKIFIEKASLEMLSGTTVDYVETLNESGFKFSNPNASSGCGCGKSFR